MRRIVVLLILPALVLCTPGRGAAQNSDPSAQGTEGGTLTLEKAVDIAVRNNPYLTQSRLDMDRADYRVNEALGYALPNLGASGQYAYMLKKPVFFLPGTFMGLETNDPVAVPIGANNSYQAGFTATQVLFNAAVFTGVGTAKIFQRVSREQYRGVYNATVSNVKRAFYGVLFMREVARVAKASLDNSMQSLKQVEIMNGQGIVSNYDLIRAQVRVENTRPEVIKAENNVVLATNQLKIVLGLPAETPMSVSGAMEPEQLDSAQVREAERLLLENNPTLKALDLQTQVNKDLVSIYRSESLPTLAAFGTYQWQAQKEDFSKISSGDFVSSSQVGLTLSLNLFNGLQTTARVDQAQVDYLKSQEALKSTRYVLQTRIQNITSRLDESRRRIEAQGTTVSQAEKGFQIAQTRYSSGSGTLLEVNDADLALLNARLNYAQAILDFNAAKADLEELTNLAPTQN